MNKPKLLMLDEPLMGLVPIGVGQIAMEGSATEGMTDAHVRAAY